MCSKSKACLGFLPSSARRLRLKATKLAFHFVGSRWARRAFALYAPLFGRPHVAGVLLDDAAPKPDLSHQAGCSARFRRQAMRVLAYHAGAFG